MDWLAIFGIIGTFIIPILIFLYQERKPKISVTCRLVPSGDPSAIECVVSNSGRQAAQDVSIGFTLMLLNETTLISLSDTKADIVETDVPIQIHKLDTSDATVGLIFPPNLPNPNLQVNDANHVKAFAIHVNSVPAKTKVEFRLITNDNANRRAALQVMHIRESTIQRIKIFMGRLQKVKPRIIKKLKFQDFENAQIKLDCFYKPGYFSFSEGRERIAFLTKEENEAANLMETIFKEHKDSHADLFENQPTFIAPVIRFRTDSGTNTTAITPPFGTKVTLSYEGNDYQRLRRGEIVLPPIPKKYDYE